MKVTLLLVCRLVHDMGRRLDVCAQRSSADGIATSAGEVTGQGTAEQGGLPAATAEAEEHGLPRKAVEIGRPFGFPITNSMVVSWIVAVGLMLFARIATRDMTHVPGGAQNLLEWLVGGCTISSKASSARIWSSGRSGSLPQFSFSFFPPTGWASFPGWHDRLGTSGPHGFVIEQPLFRGANADLNLTLAMALVFFACWIVWAMQEVGPGDS